MTIAVPLSIYSIVKELLKITKNLQTETQGQEKTLPKDVMGERDMYDHKKKIRMAILEKTICLKKT